MSRYTAPINDMQFVLADLAGLDEVSRLPGYEEATPDVVESVLNEAARFAGTVLAPLNSIGDRVGLRWDDGRVSLPEGFKAAFAQFAQAGWTGLRFDPQYGGQGLPKLVDAVVSEMWSASNMAFAMAPLLTQGAIEALLLRGTPAQKHTYLPRMVAGAWTGTMNLTEPQAGSDLALIRSRATPQGDHYRIVGQKIFISFGEHDLADNIVHLVLARTPHAPEGVRGLSLFVVPKVLVNADGSLGERNDLRCVSVEHKVGIHSSPTAVLSFGDQGGAIGTLLGEENRGVETMFIMMNEARFGVGMQAVAIADRAYQQALAWAHDRIQGRDASGGQTSVPIIRHPDVRRMLMSMKSRTEAMRALAYVVAGKMDIAHHHPDEMVRARQQSLVDLLIPVLKGWSTETAVDVASLGMQIHGGMGYIEETGAAQHWRDARITTIYEGTTGIQANDLVARKILRENGQTLNALIEHIKGLYVELGKAPGEHFSVIRRRLQGGVEALSDATDWIVATGGKDLGVVLAGAVPFLHLFGHVLGGWQMARAALIAQDKLAAGEGDAAFNQAKIASARFYADHVLTQCRGLCETAVHGAAASLAMAEAQF